MGRSWWLWLAVLLAVAAAVLGALGKQLWWVAAAAAAAFMGKELLDEAKRRQDAADARDKARQNSTMLPDSSGRD